MNRNRENYPEQLAPVPYMRGDEPELTAVGTAAGTPFPTCVGMNR